MSRQAVRLSTESSYGVFSAPSVKNTDYVVVDIDSGNAFSMRPQPVQHPVRSAEGWNRRRRMVSGQSKVAGKLTTMLYPEQTSFFFNLATTLTGSPDLNSVTIDHQFSDASFTKLYRRYLGCKVAMMKLSFTADSPLAKLELDLVGQKPASPNISVSDFPDPPASDYPVGIPFTFFQLSSPGNLTITSSRSEFSSLDFTWKNYLDSPFFESQYVSRCNWNGRDLDLSVKLALKGNTDRLAYEATQADPVSVRLDNGTNHVILQMGAANFMTSVGDDLPLDKVVYQTLQFASFYDSSAGADFSFAYT